MKARNWRSSTITVHPRPEVVDAAELAKLPKLDLIKIDDPVFGGWAKAQPYHFDDGGVFDQLYKASN